MEGLTNEDIEQLNEVLEKMTVPAQKNLVKELENLKPSKRKNYLKKFFNERKKLISERSKILKKIEKQKEAEKAFELISKALEISEELADDEHALKIAHTARTILNKMDKDPELKNVVTKHRTKLLKSAEELNKNAQKKIYDAEFFKAGVIYRKSARAALIANNEEQYKKYIQLANDCDSQGTV